MTVVPSHRPSRKRRVLLARLVALLAVPVTVLAIAYIGSHAWTLWIVIPGLWVSAYFAFRPRR